MKNIFLQFIIFFTFLSLTSSEKEILSNSKIFLHTKIFSGCDNRFGALYFAKLALAHDAHLNSSLAGNTILHYAAQHNECPLFEFLIVFKKESIALMVNKQNKPTLHTALHYTISHNNYQRTETLLKLNANPTIKNINGITPLILSKKISSTMHTLVSSYAGAVKMDPTASLRYAS